MVLGTDSLASNQQLSILEEMKTIKQNFPINSHFQNAGLGYIQRSKGISFDEHLGDFAKNKKPGIVLVENFVRVEKLVQESHAEE